MPKVFVINRGGHDYSAAQNFGELVFLSDGVLDRYKTHHMFRLAKEAMEDSTPNDYLLLTSLPTLCVIAASVFVAKHHKLNLLLFRNGEYMIRSLSFNGDDDDEGGNV